MSPQIDTPWPSVLVGPIVGPNAAMSGRTGRIYGFSVLGRSTPVAGVSYSSPAERLRFTRERSLVRNQPRASSKGLHIGGFRGPVRQAVRVHRGGPPEHGGDSCADSPRPAARAVRRVRHDRREAVPRAAVDRRRRTRPNRRRRRRSRSCSTPRSAPARCNCRPFDEQNLAEITAPEDYPGERLIACRNPLVAADRARKREELLAATERGLREISDRVERGTLRGADRIGPAVGPALNPPPSTSSPSQPPFRRAPSNSPPPHPSPRRHQCDTRPPPNSERERGKSRPHTGSRRAARPSRVPDAQRVPVAVAQLVERALPAALGHRAERRAGEAPSRLG